MRFDAHQATSVLRTPVFALGAARRAHAPAENCVNNSPASGVDASSPCAFATSLPLTHTPRTPTASVVNRAAPPGRSKTRCLGPRATVCGSNSSRSAAYLKWRRAVAGEPTEEGEGEALPVEAAISQDRLVAMSAAEQFVLTISENGFGKRTSSFEYRVTGRGGKGIVAMVVNDRNGRLVASFPIAEKDQIILVTDGGQLIRCPVHDVRIAGRNTQGVRIFKTDGTEKVVSVESVSEETVETEGDAAASDATGNGSAAAPDVEPSEE